MRPGKSMLAALLAVITAFILIAIFGCGEDIKGAGSMRYGIDIRGGVEAVFEADTSTIPTEKELDTARDVLEVRMDMQNITDREVTVDKDGEYIIVRFPWKSNETDFNPEKAIQELGEMAQLKFCDEEGNVLIEGKHVKSSSVETDNQSLKKGYMVNLSFDEDGAKAFEKATGEMIGRQIGIYMDDQLISNPVVQAKISGGQAVIDGMENYEEAKILSDKINSGALPFSLKTTSFSTISPSMGNSALDVMVIAGVIAFIAVCLFMLIYYKLPGAVACLTLLLQMTLQLLAVSVPQYTLTLPGIAGIILSLGMAVDANIIISERISEELKKGYTVYTSIRNGYKNGFTSVLDGNITTAAVAVILMIFGSGSMLSFGYTLFAGMLINLLAGVTISKQLLFSIITYRKWNDVKWFRKKEALHIGQFYQKKWICFLISGIILVIGFIGIYRNDVSLDTQFTGGAVFQYELTGTADEERLTKEIEALTKRTVHVQETKNKQNNLRELEITLAGKQGITLEQQNKIGAIVKSSVSNGSAEIKQTYAVEPYIGAKALKNAGIAIGLSMLFIMTYVCIRFSILSGMTAGVTAIIALIHDALVVFFTFVLWQIPLNDAFVAVILTIIGYSINDTIVVYDRIRENRKNGSYGDIAQLNNLSVSQVIGRSVNTSLTTGICVLTILIAASIFHIESIWKFALPMLFGLISGCYSSICIAGNLWAMFEKRKLKGDKKL